MPGGKTLTAGIRGMHTLTDLFVQLSYSPEKLVPSDRVRAIEVWQALRWRLWLARLRRWFTARKRQRVPAATSTELA